MWFQKKSVIITTFITILTLLLAILINSIGKEFAKDIAINIFSGALLSMVLSIFSYDYERKQALESFRISVQKCLKNINRFKWNGDIDQTIDVLIQMDDFDYSDLHYTFGNISFIFNDKKKRRYIFDKIYQPILNVIEDIHERAYHFRLYKQHDNWNSIVIKSYIEELDDIIMKEEIKKIENPDNTETIYKYRHNNIYHLIDKEMNGEYYNLMYPFKNKKH